MPFLGLAVEPPIDLLAKDDLGDPDNRQKRTGDGQNVAADGERAERAKADRSETSG